MAGSRDCDQPGARRIAAMAADAALHAADISSPDAERGLLSTEVEPQRQQAIREALAAIEADGQIADKPQVIRIEQL